MINRLALVASVAVTTLFSTSVVSQGDWQYTKWSMPLEELLSLEGHGIAKTSTEERNGQSLSDSLQALARADHIVVGVKSRAFFEFDDNLLAAVYISLPDGKTAGNALLALEGQYGPPFENTTEGGACSTIAKRWRVSHDHNMIGYRATLCGAKGFYSITYRPIADAVDSGL
jgi:hypothetical protein